jgi:hypothetical protein
MKPTEEEFQAALEEAERLREDEEDTYFLAKSLFYLYKRNLELEQVMEHLERFLQFGLPVEEHSELIRIVEQVREEERRERGENAEDFGL